MRAGPGDTRMSLTPTRRSFLDGMAALACLSIAEQQGVALAAAAADADANADERLIPADADLGPLQPFIESQAPGGPAELSYLQARFQDVAAWKREARGKLLELLSYAPPKCDARPEVVEKVDRGDYVQ